MISLLISNQFNVKNKIKFMVELSLYKLTDMIIPCENDKFKIKYKNELLELNDNEVILNDTSKSLINFLQKHITNNIILCVCDPIDLDIIKTIVIDNNNIKTTLNENNKFLEVFKMVNTRAITMKDNLGRECIIATNCTNIKSLSKVISKEGVNSYKVTLNALDNDSYAREITLTESKKASDNIPLYGYRTYVSKDGIQMTLYAPEEKYVQSKTLIRHVLDLMNADRFNGEDKHMAI